MKKPTIYIDTSIISAYWYDGSDIPIVSRRMHTREWWDLERAHFAIWTSAFTEAELRAGKFGGQKQCIKMVRRMHFIPLTSKVREFARLIVDNGIVPPNKLADAAQLAIATTHAIDYLLTWNYAHMANASVQARLEKLCRSSRIVAPLMVSPESIPQVRFGQELSRKT